jgi:hypothetical protein
MTTQSTIPSPTGENVFIHDKHFFVVFDETDEQQSWMRQSCRSFQQQFEMISSSFCGNIATFADIIAQEHRPDTLVFIYGDIQRNYAILRNVPNIKVCVIGELSYNYGGFGQYQIVSIGEVPLNINNVGVMFPCFFDMSHLVPTHFATNNFFNAITESQKFQKLHLSNLPGDAYRTAYYTTPVTENPDGSTNFHLLRCSTSLEGPTLDQSPIDRFIFQKANSVLKYFFRDQVDLNHALVQIYNNVRIGDKDKKAKISKHSDKTKDMPRNGVMAFATFYKNFENGAFTDRNEKSYFKGREDPYDIRYKNCDGESVLTRLRFELKDCAKNPVYVGRFDIKMYPNSLFLMDLKTNRIYTHEIFPSQLEVNKIPCRMGYVMRCSKTTGVHRNGKVHIVSGQNEIEMVVPTAMDLENLGAKYKEENITANFVEYGDVFFSMNVGDYEKPTPWNGYSGSVATTDPANEAVTQSDSPPVMMRSSTM